ncbi:uncharacterized protein LOC121240249 isoform X2 [Juglans microcarpa x Juglans regia]|uniref:uncharacterized protein LOC121240249 isoform X2 n=1 Tax=Juglans microcarpa x Juglans regia TaxID=2249226 RepID=UPI001B7E90C4|nr:uncharacterized protein LOC121240249 isoform X2 [Juglans microcarpa x Juglans regia]
MAERRDDEELRKFSKLYNAVRGGNLDEVKVILESLPPDALNCKIPDKGKTALHTAVTHAHEHIVEALVMQMSNKGLTMYDSDGHTALTMAVLLGKWRMVECMLRKYFDLISIRHSEGKNLPVVMAIDFGHIEMARQLYYLTPNRDLIPQDNDEEIQDPNGATLFTRAIYTGTFDIALGLILTCPRLALALDKDDESPILALASIRHSFPSGIQLGFCKQRVYSYMRIPFAPPTSETRLNVSNGDQRQSNQEDQNIISGITQLYELKKIHVQYNELLSHMCKVISESKTQQLEDGRVYSAINQATKNGSFEFVSKMLETDLRFIWYRDEDRRNIFMLAVLHRQEKIFSILYSGDMMMSYNAMKCLQDVDGNNILHMAGRMLKHSTRVNQIPGAALQMQRELQWFKEVERIVHPKDKETTNEDGLTPRQLFTKDHENMMEKGEKWMKDTARSCTVVGALIVTIMFAVAFTIPGGNNQDTGLPIFLNKKSFRVFMISDALSFFLSSTSVLMFLGILTSRYTEDDFLEYLPRQMIIGLSTLFCSIATMMLTFASALLIILHEQSRIAIPLICLGGVPVTIFLWIQLPILKDMIISTYGPSIFDRKMKLKL